MAKKQELILAGSGGQGLVMMGILLGQAANEAGYTVAQTQSYGIAARGGVSYSEVVISEEEIIYPKVTDPDMILALTEETYWLFRRKYPEKKILVDADAIDPKDDPNARALPLSTYCREVGDMRVLNLLSIGVVLGATAAIPREAVEQTIAQRFPKATEINLAAFHRGIEMIVGAV